MHPSELRECQIRRNDHNQPHGVSGQFAVVFEASREFKILAENQLDAGIMASPAVSGNALFVRTKTHLYRIEEE